MEDFKFKSGFVSIIGRSNVGKSTLLNAITGEKISIVTDKPQTTRANIRGIYNDSESQIVFIDTPGVQKPKNKLGNYMLKQSTMAASDTDIIMMVVDESTHIGQMDRKIIDGLKKFACPRILVINKMDKMSQEDLFKMIETYNALGIFDEIIPASGLKKINITEIVSTLKKYMVYGQKYYPDDMSTDQSNTVLISEIIREKVLLYLNKEVPHGIAIEIEKIENNPEKDMLEIWAVINCEKESHKKIVIGNRGKKIKGIGKAARIELEEVFGCKVNLQTWVKVKENWRDNQRYIADFGFKE